MRIISKSHLKRFWQSPGNSESENPLKAWHQFVKSKTITWRSWADVKATFASASLVGNCVVFNIGGNKYRLVTRILYPSHVVLILKVMTHREYDDDQWKTDCGCYPNSPSKQKGN